MGDKGPSEEQRRCGVRWYAPIPLHIVQEAGDMLTLTSKVDIFMADTTEKAVVDAIIEEARRAGFDQGFVIDRSFVLAAIKEKIEREKLIEDGGDEDGGKSGRDGVGG